MAMVLQLILHTFTHFHALSHTFTRFHALSCYDNMGVQRIAVINLRSVVVVFCPETFSEKSYKFLGPMGGFKKKKVGFFIRNPMFLCNFQALHHILRSNFQKSCWLEVISSVFQPEIYIIFLFTLLYLGNKGSYQKTVKSRPPLIFGARRNGNGPAADLPKQTKPSQISSQNRESGTLKYA